MNVFSTEKFRRRLLAWYRKHRRDLPWRRTQDPYAIWVSEIMLQQTQVKTVIPYYLRFLERFPTLDALADADEAAVLASWAGLGYYRRCRLLQQGARHVQAQYGGALPQAPDALESIPGIGPYTAGAIASIAFQRSAPLVDGNVIRVFSRLFGLKGSRKSSELKNQIWQKARELIDPHHPGDFNQALMELGATCCRSQIPACERCPVATQCRALKLGRPADFPESAPPDKTVQLHRMVAVCRRGDAVLLVKKKHGRWFQGMWELPHDYPENGAEAGDLQAFLRADFGLLLKNPRPNPETRHSITHHRILTRSWHGQTQGRLRLNKEFLESRWCEPARLTDYPLPNLDRKVLVVAGLLGKE